MSLPPRGDHRQPARAQQHRAAGQDLGEPGEQPVQALVGEAGRVVAVAVVVLADAAFGAAPLLGLDLAVNGRAVRGRGDATRAACPAVPGGSRPGSSRASPRITPAVPAAPWRRACPAGRRVAMLFSCGPETRQDWSGLGSGAPGTCDGV
ncbi:MAG: hypothetical protein JO285_02920 [Kutzneria sp.]|nr:hypothetical protein [Kutzneria sp.]